MDRTDSTQHAAEAAAAPVLDPLATACAIARGEQSDPAASGISIRGAWRDLNARGRGSESYRRRLPAGERVWAWVSGERLPRTGSRASERRCRVNGEVFDGDLVATFSRMIDSRVGAVSIDAFALVVTALEKPLRTCEHKRRRDGQYDVTLPDGSKITVASPEWR